MEAPNAHVVPVKKAPKYRTVRENFGLFVHLVPGLTTDQAGVVSTLETIEQFDVQSFVQHLKQYQVQYLRFTAWHKGMITLYPSEVMARWRENRAHANRDIIGEIISAVAPLGIKVQLYTHPRDGHDFSLADQRNTGWGRGLGLDSPNPNPSDFNFTRWNQFVAEAYEELLVRYGDQISAIYLDEGSELGDSEWVVDYPRLRGLVNKHAPDVVMIQNYYGNKYCCDMADHEYGRWGEFADVRSAFWPTFKNQSISTVVGSSWWASKPGGTFAPGFEVVELYRYLVMQIAASTTGGGIAFAAGPFADGGWEKGVSVLLTELGQLFVKYGASLEYSTCSYRWPVQGGATISSINWGVALDSGLLSYLHIFNPPEDGLLKLHAPMDGSEIFSVGKLNSDVELDFTKTKDGFLVIDCSDLFWDFPDTVLVISTSPSPVDSMWIDRGHATY